MDYLKTQGLTSDTTTQNKIIEGLCVGGKARDAEMFLSSLEEKRPDNYSAMIEGYCEGRHTLKAFQLFTKLYREGAYLKKRHA